MKKLLTGLALMLAAYTAPAQIQITLPPPDDPSSYRQLVDSLISPLDKSLIPTSILYDRVLASAGLHIFNQYTSSSATHFFQSYFELREASYLDAAFPLGRSALRPQAAAAAASVRYVVVQGAYR